MAVAGEPGKKSADDVALGETMAVSDAIETAVASSGPVRSSARTLESQRVGGGRYEVMSLLGTGGMGTVYRARDTELDEVVALKVLQRELVDDPAMLARFRQEAKLARRVTHRNVARTFDIGEHEGERFLTMEYVEGESLAGLAERRGRMPVAEVAAIVEQITAGVAAAHAAGVVHRDLKPENVLVARDGRIVVTDFGIARAAAGTGGASKTVGGIVGTPAYMAPEQVEASNEVDGRADIYALGAMVYELLTGTRAWPGDSPFAVAAARLVNPPPDPRRADPTLPAAVATVIQTAMARQPAARYPDVTAFAVAFREAAALEAPRASEGRASLPPATTTPATLHGQDKTVAVLPFRNGGAPEDEYLADGVTEDLIDLLSMTNGLKVRPRGAVAHLRGQEADPQKVGRELDVQVVVEGSVRRTAATIRVSARLVSATDGFQLWAKRFDRPAADVLGVNDEAATAIAEALTVSDNRKARVAPTNPAAIDLYLRANHESAKFWHSATLRAIELYEQALALAPDDPTILARSARARVRAAFFGGDGAAEMLAKAHAAADRAVVGAPDLGESWAALAAVRRLEGDLSGAVRAAKAALDRAKGLAPAHDILARILVEAGDPRQAMAHWRTALAIDPTDFNARCGLARAHALYREWQAASDLLDVSTPVAGDSVSRFLFRCRIGLWRGEGHPDLANPPDIGQALGALSDLPRFSDLFTKRTISPDARAALEEQARTTDLGRGRMAFFFQLHTEFYSVAGEVGNALSSLKRSIDAGLTDVAWMDLCAALDPLRTDPRWSALRAEVLARVLPVREALRG